VRRSWGDELLSRVAERVRPHRAGGQGQGWALAAAHHARLEELLGAGLTVVKAGELLAREGVVVPERTLHRYALERRGVRRGHPGQHGRDRGPGSSARGALVDHLVNGRVQLQSPGDAVGYLALRCRPQADAPQRVTHEDLARTLIVVEHRRSAAGRLQPPG
jgi:hypothetical protein